MDNEKRLWLALGLSTLVIIGWSWWMGKTLPPPPASLAAEPVAAPDVPAEKVDAKAARRARTHAGVARATAVAPSAAPDGEDVTVETESMIARLATAGGRVVSWQLKSYRAAGTTVFEELVPLKVARSAEGPLTVRLADDPEAGQAAAAASLAALSVADGELRQRLPGRGRETAVTPLPAGRPGVGELVLTQRLARGRTLIRRLTVPARGYVAGLELELRGPAPSSLEVLWRPGVGLSPDEEEFLHRAETYQNLLQAVVLTHKDKLKQTDAKEPTERVGGEPFWAAVHNKYFAAALIAPTAAACEGVTAVAGFAASDGVPHALSAGLRFTLAPGATRVRIPLKVFAGPMEYGLLERAGDRLEKVLDLGFFGVLALPLLQTLHFLHGFVHNYGVAIILLTLAIRGVLWMPSQWGMNQMKQMQAMKPQLDFINEQYKDDPTRRNEETMRIYKEKGINPVGGCLPLLLQIPVMIALFSSLSNAIELRGAPFALWITDLSARDPYFVSPVLVGVTMWLQQRMTPVAGDPMQAKMMQWMPVVMTFIFRNMPAGLMVYWLVQNLVQIAQQWNTNRSLAPAKTGG